MMTPATHASIGMQRRTFWLVAVGVLAGCHDDACVWTVTRTGESSTATLARGGADVAAVEAIVLGETFVHQTTSDNATRSSRVTVKITTADETAIFFTELGDPAANSVVDASAGTLRVVRGMTILDEGAPAGVISIGHNAPHCEKSDAYGDSSSHWACATNLDATIDVERGGYRITGSLSVREVLAETCHACGGIEGCDY